MSDTERIIVVKWRGRELKTLGEIYGTAVECESKEDAEEFWKALMETGLDPQVAKSNIGYWAGYYGQSERARVHEFFGAAHPIFDTSNPTPGEAFKMGMEMGKK